MKNNNLKKTLMENVFLFIFIFFLLFLLIFLLQLLVNNNSMFNNLKPIENKNLLDNISKNEETLINNQVEKEKVEKLFNAKMEDIVLNKKVNNKIQYLYLSFEVKSKNENIQNILDNKKMDILDKIIINFDNMYKVDFSNKNDKFFFKKELISILEQELNDKESLIKDLYFTKYLIKQN